MVVSFLFNFSYRVNLVVGELTYFLLNSIRACQGTRNRIVYISFLTNAYNYNDITRDRRVWERVRLA
jgi:hypothetical protein